MKTAFNCVGMYCLYAFRSIKFWAACLIYLLLLIFGTADFYNESAGVYYLLHYALQNGTKEFGLVVCAIPAAGIFADEWCSGRFVYSYTRAKTLPYAVSVVLSAFLIAAATYIAANAAYILIFSITNPIVGVLDDTSFVQSMMSYANGGLMLKGNVGGYYIINALTGGCNVGIFSALAVLVSVIITNSYIATVSPMILYIFITNFMNFLNIPRIANPYYIFSGGHYVFSDLTPNSADNFSIISMAYPFVYALCVVAIIAMAALFGINRKYEKNSDLR